MSTRNRRFIDAVANDKVLRELLTTPAIGAKAAGLETLVSLGDHVHVGGRSYPAHTLGTYAVLDALEHPILRHPPELKTVDILTALYLLQEREKSIPLFIRNLSGAITGEEFLEELCSCVLMPDAGEADRIIAELIGVLNISGGFSMLPGNGKTNAAASTGNPAFDAEYVSSVALFIAGGFPSLTPFEITWRIPYPMAGFLIAQIMRRNGVKGIGSRVKTDEAWRRFKSIAAEQLGG